MSREAALKIGKKARADLVKALDSLDVLQAADADDVSLSERRAVRESVMHVLDAISTLNKDARVLTGLSTLCSRCGSTQHDRCEAPPSMTSLRSLLP